MERRWGSKPASSTPLLSPAVDGRRLCCALSLSVLAVSFCVSTGASPPTPWQGGGDGSPVRWATATGRASERSRHRSSHGWEHPYWRTYMHVYELCARVCMCVAPPPPPCLSCVHCPSPERLVATRGGGADMGWGGVRPAQYTGAGQQAPLLTPLTASSVALLRSCLPRAYARAYLRGQDGC